MNVNKAYRKAQALATRDSRAARKLMHRISHELAKGDMLVAKMGRME